MTSCERYPTPGWWKDENLWFSEFIRVIERFRENEYGYDEFAYTHDVYVGEVQVGEAAYVEGIPGILMLGFVSIAKGRPTYCMIDPKFKLVEKE